jgi:hypothetical protein
MINACTETEIQSVFSPSTYNVWKNKAGMHVNVFLAFLFAGGALREREREREREHTHLPESPVCTLRWALKNKKRLKRLVRNAAVAAGNSADAALAPIVVKVF